MTRSLPAVPQPLETIGGGAGVMGRVLGLAVAEIVLDQPQVVALVREIEAAGVAEHVRADRRQPGACHGSASERVARWRLIARSSSPAIGCSTDRPFFNRLTQSRARSRSTSPRRR